MADVERIVQMNDFVGLDINGPGACGAKHPVSQRPCIKPAGHEQSGDTDHSSEVELEPEAPSCPDCGGEMHLEFSVVADDEEVARRVFLSYQVLKDIDVEKLMLLLEGHHVHIVPDAECAEDNCGDGA